jgi:hypothetical protein
LATAVEAPPLARQGLPLAGGPVGGVGALVMPARAARLRG